MFKFKWSELVTNDFLEKLQGIAGEDITTYRGEIKRVVALILKNTGGLPIVNADLTTVRIVRRPNLEVLGGALQALQLRSTHFQI